MKCATRESLAKDLKTRWEFGQGALNMACAEEKIVAVDPNEEALKEFEEGVRRSIRQADAGLVKSFKIKKSS